MTKYKLGRNGWDISGPSYHYSDLWKDIISVREIFKSHIIFQVGAGSSIFF